MSERPESSMTAVAAFELAMMQSASEGQDFIKVAAYIQRKIATAATLGHKDVIVQVPNYIPDTLEFNLPLMVESIILHLTELGYYVKLLTFPSLYVSWRYAVQPREMI